MAFHEVRYVPFGQTIKRQLRTDLSGRLFTSRNKKLNEHHHELWNGDATPIAASRTKKQKTDSLDAFNILDLPLTNRFPRIWIQSRTCGRWSGIGTAGLFANLGGGSVARPGRCAIAQRGSGSKATAQSASPASAHERNCGMTGSYTWNSRKASSPS
jgi:hypothetical protein